MALGDAGSTVDVDALPAEVRNARASPATLAPTTSDERGVSPLGMLERDAMQSALQACSGNVSDAARRLGVSRSTLYRRLGLVPPAAAIDSGIKK